jgi:nitric oxide dioxygenase
MAALGFVVNALDAPDTMADGVRGLARRHVGYGVGPEDYRAVGAALVWALEAALGPAFTPAVKDAWRSAYQALCDTMIAEGRSGDLVMAA